MFSIYKLFKEVPVIDIVDVGAAPIDGPPVYAKLVDTGNASVMAFDPNTELCKELNTAHDVTYSPLAIGCGKPDYLNICKAPGMTSLRSPDDRLLKYFKGYPEWSELIKLVGIDTARLCDVVSTADFIKLDTQGTEHDIIESSLGLIRNALVIHTEVEFVCMYYGQTLFDGIMDELDHAGFYFHRFFNLSGGIFKGFADAVPGTGGFSQTMWADAVFVRKFDEFEELTTEKLIKLAIILHEVYQSYDMCHLSLEVIDKTKGSHLGNKYIDMFDEAVSATK